MRKYTSLPFTEFVTGTGNFDSNRKTIKKVIIHSIVGTVGSAINRFKTNGAGVSAHYIIGNDGKLWAGLEEYYVAYHSGNYLTNQESVGIEHEWYSGLVLSDALYETSAKLVADLCREYKLPCDRQHVLPHKEVVPTQCPNAVDVDRIIRRANEILNPGAPTNPSDPCEALRKEISFKDKVIGERDLTIVELNKIIETLKKDVSFRDKVIGERDATVVILNKEILELKKKLEDLPPATNCDVYTEKISEVKKVVWDRWTWIGTRGWKNRLNQLKTLLS